jgi:hypothetical protein
LRCTDGDPSIDRIRLASLIEEPVGERLRFTAPNDDGSVVARYDVMALWAKRGGRL